MAINHAPIPASEADFSPAWISTALGLGTPEAVTTEPIGTGNAATTLRVRVNWVVPGHAPDSFVAKISAPAGSEQRKAAEGWHAYEVEAEFYKGLAPELDADIPRCHWAGYDPASGSYAVVLEDLSGLTPGDNLVGGDPELAARALAEIALVHAPRWGDPALAEMTWLNRYPRGQGGTLHEEMTVAGARLDVDYADDLDPVVRDTVRQFAALSDRYDRKGFGRARTIAHGDFRDDNLMFSADRVCIMDWQTVQLSSGVADVAYYLAGSLRLEDRRTHERELVRGYHQRLRAHGVDLDWGTCWLEYRRHGLSLLTTALKTVAQRPNLPPRARDMVLSMLRRGVAQALDLESLGLLKS
jgi:hypothetical protein